jgi:integrase
LGLSKKEIDVAEYEGNGKSWDVRYDDTIPGFGIRVYPSGIKSFVLRYRNRSGRTRLLTLGRYGVLTLPQARERARRALVDVLDGIDPAEEKKKPKGITVSEFSEVYLDLHAKQRKKTWREDARRLENTIIPAIGSRALHDVRRADVTALHSNVGSRAPVEANRVAALISVMFTLAEKWEYLPEGSPNPASGIDLFPERSRDRYVTPKELPRLVKAIELEPNVYVRAVLWMYLLTGVRKSELLNAQWSDIDIDRCELRIEETKAGRPHIVPLSEPAMQVLEQLPRQQGNPYIFPGARPGRPLAGFSKNWRTIRKRANLEDLRLHDLRRTVGSWLAMSGASLPLIGKVLNHSNPSTTAIYARLAEDAARAALEDYGRQILETAHIEDVSRVVGPNDDG